MKHIVIGLLLAGLSLAACAHEVDPQPDSINVSGSGEIEAEPDQAVLNISVTARKPDLATAKQLADQRYRSVLQVIEQAGIEDKLIKATRVSAQPEYEYRNNQRVYKGERVSRSLSITINDLDKVAPLMQQLVENGVSTIDGMSTGFQDKKALQRKALAAAADDARSKAGFLAERLGRSLGVAYLINEHNNAPPVHYQREMAMATKSMAAAEAPPPEMFGTQKISATIKVSFYLL